MIDPAPAGRDRLRRIAFPLTLAGLAASAPIVIAWLRDGTVSGEGQDGLATLAAASFAAAAILFVAAGRAVGAIVALPAIAIGSLLHDPETMALALLVAAPIAEVAGSVATFGAPDAVTDALERAFAELRSSTVSAVRHGPLRLPSDGRAWVLDRAAVATAVASVVAVAAWALLVSALGAGDDPMTRTVLPSATEFPVVLGAGLALGVASAALCFATGRVPGVLIAATIVPAVWLDAPVRSEVTVTVLVAACGLAAVLASPIPSAERS